MPLQISKNVSAPVADEAAQLYEWDTTAAHAMFL
jgi:hypothetical protein